MADTKQVNMSKLEHVKAGNFINEVADRFTLTGVHNGGSLSIILTVGRDSVDISHETVIPADEGGGMRLDTDAMKPFRLDFATLTLSLEAAKGLAEALQKMINDAPQNGTAV